MLVLFDSLKLRTTLLSIVLLGIVLFRAASARLTNDHIPRYAGSVVKCIFFLKHTHDVCDDVFFPAERILFSLAPSTLTIRILLL